MTTPEKLTAAFDKLDSAYVTLCKYHDLKHPIGLYEIREIKTHLQEALSLMQGVENDLRGVPEPLPQHE